MKAFAKTIITKIIPFILIGMMISLIANKAIFYHSHKLENGSIVSHAHPYNKTQDSTPFKTHHHSKTELLFFQSLDTLFFVLFLVSLILLSIATKPFLSHSTNNYYKAYYPLRLGRAPPIS